MDSTSGRLCIRQQFSTVDDQLFAVMKKFQEDHLGKLLANSLVKKNGETSVKFSMNITANNPYGDFIDWEITSK